jgi:micrococcal nuclease
MVYPKSQSHGVQPLIGTAPPVPLDQGTDPARLTDAVVTRVVDGDTIDVRLGSAVEPVRFIGMNAPEVTSQPECYGREAAAFVAQLVPVGSTVRLERDVTDRDQFGRLLRYIWLPDGRLLNEVVVAEGYAQSPSFPPDTRYQQRILAAQQAARAANKGLWAACQTSSADATVPVQFVSVQGGPPGGRASVTAQTRPSVICSIRYVTPAGTESQASGLGNKPAGANGGVSWSWNIGPSTRPETGKVTVTCGTTTATTDIIIG